MSEAVLDAPLGPAQRRRSLLFLGLAVAALSLAMGIQQGLNENYVVSDIGVNPFERGGLEASREACGILALGILAMLAGFAEPLVGAGMILLAAFGLSSYAYIHDYVWVVAMSLVWSQGLHCWMPLPSSMALALAEPGRAGHRLGQIGAAGAAGFGLGLAVAWVLSRAGTPMRPMYVVAGAAAALGAAACLGIPRKVKTPGPRLVFRRRYGIYYALTFLEGWRKQVFICFAPFMLVFVYKTPLESMLILWGVVQVINYFASPHVGRLIDRVGERRILIVYYAGIIPVFAGYALVGNIYVLYGLFIVDSFLFLLVMALTTYVNRIVPRSEHTQTLSMGVAMNHVAAVAMPLLGGYVWKMYGYQWTFVIAGVAAVLSLLVSMRVPAKESSKFQA
jgi:MFS family permease